MLTAHTKDLKKVCRSASNRTFIECLKGTNKPSPGRISRVVSLINIGILTFLGDTGDDEGCP